MPVNPSLPALIWVDTPAALSLLAAELARQPRIAVDTESNSLHAYREQVCLIQFSTLQADYLVDPLALNDLAALAPIFANPQVEKIFHAAEYDLICLERDFGFNFANLFDTMLAARILGYRQVGLGNMLAEKFGAVLNKRYQKADWAQRPLPADLRDYARLDTRHLLALRDLLRAELVQAGRWPLASEDFIRICQVSEQNGFACPAWQRVKGAQKLSERALAILQELCHCRETLARRMNRPLFKVVNDTTLVNIAQIIPRTGRELQHAGLSPYQMRRFGDDLLRAVQRGLQARPVQRPAAPRTDKAYLMRLDALSKWRRRVARTLGVESDVILPRPYLLAITEKNPQDMATLAEVMSPSTWRLEHYGAEILAVLKKCG